MKKNRGRPSIWEGAARSPDLPGIVIAHGPTWGNGGERFPGVRAFVYGEKQPSLPALPFGRWRRAS
jgi:hypothetical protein